MSNFWGSLQNKKLASLFSTASESTEQKNRLLADIGVISLIFLLLKNKNNR